MNIAANRPSWQDLIWDNKILTPFWNSATKICFMGTHLILNTACEKSFQMHIYLYEAMKEKPAFKLKAL